MSAHSRHLIQGAAIEAIVATCILLSQLLVESHRVKVVVTVSGLVIFLGVLVWTLRGERGDPAKKQSEPTATIKTSGKARAEVGQVDSSADTVADASDESEVGIGKVKHHPPRGGRPGDGS